MVMNGKLLINWITATKSKYLKKFILPKFKLFKMLYQ